MKVSIDRFEGKVAVCEQDNGKTLNIEKSRLPKGVKAGDVLDIDGDTITVDPEETKHRKAQIEKLVNDLFD